MDPRFDIASRSAGDRLRHGRRRSRILLAPLALAGLLALAPVGADAATVTGAWQAKVGSGGANGSAKVTVYAGGGGSLTLKLAKLKPATTLPVTLAKGTCGSVGATLIRLPVIRTTSTGAAARTSTLTAGQISVITNATLGTGRFSVRIGIGSAAKCGLFTAVVVPPRVSAQIAVGGNPIGVAVTPGGIVVTNASDATLSRVDPATNTLLSNVRLALPGPGGPVAVAYGEGGLWVAVALLDASGEMAAGQVQRFDPATYQVVATIPVGKFPSNVAAGGGAVWVTNYMDGTVARIDPTTNQVVATIPVGADPYGVAVDFGSAWVASEGTGAVVRIDAATNQVVATIPTIGAAEGVTTGAGAVWVTNWGTTGQADGVLSRIDPTTNQVVRTIPVGSNPLCLAFGGGSVWVGMHGEETVVQVNASNNTVTARLTVGGADTWAVAATDHEVWSVQPAQRTDELSPSMPGTLTRIDF